MAAVLPSVVGEGRLSEGVFGHGRLEEDLLHGGAVARDVAAAVDEHVILVQGEIEIYWNSGIFVTACTSTLQQKEGSTNLP